MGPGLRRDDGFECLGDVPLPQFDSFTTRPLVPCTGRDMQDDEYKKFVCVEPALLKLVTLDEDAVWRGGCRVS
jgi:hypothetical protein